MLLVAATYLFNFMNLEFPDASADHGKYPGADPDKFIRIYFFDQDHITHE